MRVATSIKPDQPSREKCLVTVNVHLAGLSEKMTIYVLVARDRGEQEIHEAALARAKDFARRFASQP